MVFNVKEEKFTIPNFKMDYCLRKDSSYFHRPCCFQTSEFKYNCEKMTRKSPADNFNLCSPLFSPKAYSNVSSSILSHIVGGFVGSKSQMNSNNHNLSYDLSAAIFNLLNPCKNEKEKPSVKRQSENNFCRATSKIQHGCYEKYIVNKSSQATEKMKDCVVDVLELECLVAIPIQDFVEDENFLGFDVKCSDFKPTKGDSQPNCLEYKNSSYIDLKNKKKELLNLNNVAISHCDTSQKSENMCTNLKKSVTKAVAQMGTTNKKYLLSNQNLSKNNCDRLSESSSNSELMKKKVVPSSFNCDKLSNVNETSFKVDSEDLITNKVEYLKPLVNNLITERIRQLSECSIESTDSESFIVFDDFVEENDNRKEELLCLHIDNEEDSDSVEEDDDRSSSSDEMECDIDLVDKEVIEANEKWLESYKDVKTEEELQRKVRFNDNVKVNKIIAWEYAYREARPGPWEQMARDRARFDERITRLSSIISPVLHKEHRNKIYKQLYS